MKIYTKTGDSGSTALFGGERVSKADLRVEAYGAVDELDAYLGWAETLVRDLPLEEELRSIQADLLTVGADLATSPTIDPKVASRTVRVSDSMSTRLEALIDRWGTEVEPLTRFILPGGSPGAAALHVCRVVCRRAERQVVRLAAEEDVNPAVVVYMNRLSDLLFVLARWVNARQGGKEAVWEGRRG